MRTADDIRMEMKKLLDYVAGELIEAGRRGVSYRFVQDDAQGHYSIDASYVLEAETTFLGMRRGPIPVATFEVSSLGRNDDCYLRVRTKDGKIKDLVGLYQRDKSPDKTAPRLLPDFP